MSSVSMANVTGPLTSRDFSATGVDSGFSWLSDQLNDVVSDAARYVLDTSVGHQVLDAAQEWVDADASGLRGALANAAGMDFSHDKPPQYESVFAGGTPHTREAAPSAQLGELAKLGFVPAHVAEAIDRYDEKKSLESLQKVFDALQASGKDDVQTQADQISEGESQMIGVAGMLFVLVYFAGGAKAVASEASKLLPSSKTVMWTALVIGALVAGYKCNEQ